MCAKYSLTLFLTFQLIYFAQFKRIPKKIVVVEDFRNCPNIDISDITFRLENVKFGMVSGSKSEISFQLGTDKNMTNKLYGPVTVLKCPTVHGDEDCETILVVQIKDFCQKFLEKNQAWSFAFENVQPELTCPIQAGIYSSKGTPDLSRLKWLIDDTHAFKIYINVFEKEEFLACIYIVLKSNVVRVYVKDT
ncbi:uncharacterized protein isoform X1 [Rhodnius prolixus]|uniref:uncharacterized protein isoform X1 n=1 Tax=Rhodnius prolixus TaxID=13249 RepID=UPI003D187BFB